MSRKKLDFDTVRSIGRGLPGVVESTTYGSPSLKVRGKMFTCLPIHRSAEPDSLAIRIDFHQRAVLLAAKPEIYYLTEHYSDYPVVLVRLSRISVAELRNLLGMARDFVSGTRTSAGRAGPPRE